MCNVRMVVSVSVLMTAVMIAPAHGATIIGSNFDGIMSVIYDSGSGNVFLENAPLPNPAVQQLVIASSGGLLLPGNLTLPVLLPPLTINSATTNLIDVDWSGGDFLGTGSALGNILGSGLSQATLLSDLTIDWDSVGSPLTDGDLLYGTFGTTQGNPVLPQSGSDGFWRFFDVASGQFMDPPWASGFDYKITGDGPLFTMLGLPLGYGDSFDVVVNDVTVASGLVGGSSYTFSGAGVSEFSILGIAPAVDAANSNAFPLYLEFSTPTASFEMSPVPEPATLSLLATFSLLGLVGFGRRRKR